MNHTLLPSLAGPPPSAPQCSAGLSPESANLELTCNWDGGYPDPTFLWTEEPGGVVVGNSKLQTLSPSQLSEGKKFKCVGSHILGPESGASCVVQICESRLLCPGVGVHLPSFFLKEPFDGSPGRESVLEYPEFLPLVLVLQGCCLQCLKMPSSLSQQTLAVSPCPPFQSLSPARRSGQIGCFCLSSLLCNRGYPPPQTR